MKCKICGGDLLLQDNIYVCKSCNAKFSISAVYENTDVFIAYQETDAQGRRTKDSIIAQEIYNKLTNAKIETFYQRISTDGAAGETLEAISDFAISQAKTIVIVGTNKDSFNVVTEKYRSFFGGKKLLPVYADMEAYDMPEDVKNLQALSYSSVGSLNDLVKTILHELNRDNEYNAVDLATEREKKKRSTVLIAVIATLVLIICGILYYVFGTANVLPSRKYDAAMRAFNEGQYVDAIEKFSEISDYKDSSEQLKKIYNQYDGYYKNEDNNVSLYIDIKDNIKAVIEIRKLTENGNIIIKESTEIKGNTISFSFNDSENNQGTVTCLLEDDNVKLDITTQTITGKISIPDIKLTFILNEKSDKPLTKEVSASLVNEWLSEPHTKSQILNSGFDLTFITSDQRTGWSSYAISNTDVKIEFMNNGMVYSNEYKNLNEFDEEVVYAVTVPAETILPHKVGKKCMPFVEGTNMFFPNAEFSCYTQTGTVFAYLEEIDAIKKDTPIVCLSRTIVGEKYWKHYLENDVYSFYLDNLHTQKYGEPEGKFFSFVAENDTHCLATVATNFNNPLTPMYKINKYTYETEFVCEIPYSAPNHEKIIYLENYPQYFSEFIN